MHYNCYTCEECDARFAIQNGNDDIRTYCPQCASDDVMNTNEVIINPEIMGRSVAIKKGHI